MSGIEGHAPTPFGAASTAAEVVDGIHLAGRTALVTGASSGIGVETATSTSPISHRFATWWMDGPVLATYAAYQTSSRRSSAVR